MTKSIQSILDSYIKQMEKVTAKRLEYAEKEVQAVRDEAFLYTKLCQDYHELKEHLSTTMSIYEKSQEIIQEIDNLISKDSVSPEEMCRVINEVGEIAKEFEERRENSH